MSLTHKTKLPSPEQIKELIPVSQAVREIKRQRDAEIRQVFENRNDKFLLIVGPCSADNEAAVLDYMHRLRKIYEQVEDKIIMIPRVYTNKPRTTGEGYKGMVHQPDPEKKSDLEAGLKAIRSLHIRVAEETGFTSADEMLYPENYSYLDDILSYVAIGARSVENQQHRLTCSGLEIPVGMKNPTGGDISVMLNAIKASQLGHSFIYRGYETITNGNPLTHAIMRGFVDPYGRNFPNYHYENLLHLIEEYEARGLENPSIIVDTNHSNSNKDYKQQPRISNEVMRNIKYDPVIRKYVKGLMVESYLVAGRQEIGNGVYGQSITDACLSIEQTERMIYNIADKL